MTPRFYNLGPTGINTQEAPKVDGLVCGLLWMINNICKKHKERTKVECKYKYMYQIPSVYRLL